MMYDIIAKALRSVNLEDSHPQDYLNFYCLGNREELPHDAPVLGSNNSDKSAVVYSTLNFFLLIPFDNFFL